MGQLIHKCALYARVSTSNQLKKSSEDEDSVDRQIHRLKSFIESKPRNNEELWELKEDNIFKDEGRSGKDMDRPAFQEMLGKIQKGMINTIIATKYDRISRSVKDFLFFFESLKEYENNVEIIVLDGNVDTTSPAGELTIKMLLALAEFQRIQTAYSTREAMKILAEQGKWRGGRPPLGFKLPYEIGKDKSAWLYVDDNEFKMVEMIFDLYIEHKICRVVAEKMNEFGYTVPAYKSRRGVYHPEHDFTAKFIDTILRHKIYIGINEYNRGKLDKKKKRSKTEIFEKDSGWKNEVKLIDIEKFNMVQELLSRNRKQPKMQVIAYPYVFASTRVHLYCEHCKQNFRGTSSLKDGKRYYYYIHEQKKLNDCPVNNIPVQDLEQIIFNRIAKLIEKENLFENLYKQTDNKRKVLVTDLKSKKRGSGKKLNELKIQKNKKISMCESKEDFEKYLKSFID